MALVVNNDVDTQAQHLDMDDLNQPVAVLDADGLIVRLNPKFIEV